MGQRMETARLHLGHCECEDEAFHYCILTMDKAWAHSYAPELKRQLSGITKDHHAHENVDRKRVS
jgi:hypothetical protein